MKKPRRKPKDRDASRQVTRRSTASYVVALLFVCVSGLFVWQAWISDDAFISFRTVENAVEGRGLTWNPGERVQVFTHPLWLLTLVAFCKMTNEYYLTPIILGLVFSVACLWFLLPATRASASSRIAGLLALGLSVSFVSFTTSGLENSLTYLLLTGFLALLWHPTVSKWRGFLLGLLAGLALVNRLDNVWLFGIPLLFELYRQKDATYRRLILLGSAPVFIWLAFALLYYGSLLPNSAVAKLHTGIPRADYLQQGVTYLLDAIRFEPLLIALPLAAVALVAWRRLGDRSAALATALVAHFLYVVWVGGDFMRGRFLSAPYLLAVALLMRGEFALPPRLRPWLPLGLLVLAMPSLDRVWLVQPRKAEAEQVLAKSSGIVDERAHYFRFAGLRTKSLEQQIGHSMPALYALRNSDPARLRIVNSAGRVGFTSGPDIHLVDSYSLTSPLMSRLAIRDDKPWRIGHFERLVPKGYLSAILGIDGQIADPHIRKLYARVESASRKPLFSFERFKNILALNNPFSRKAYSLAQEQFVDDQECLLLAREKLRLLDTQLLFGAAKLEIVAGNLDSAESILRRLFVLLRNPRRTMVSARDYIAEFSEVCTVLARSRFAHAERLLLFTAQHMPNRQDPLLTLAALYEEAGRIEEARQLRQTAAQIAGDS